MEDAAQQCKHPQSQEVQGPVPSSDPHVIEPLDAAFRGLLAGLFLARRVEIWRISHAAGLRFRLREGLGLVKLECAGLLLAVDRGAAPIPQISTVLFPDNSLILLKLSLQPSFQCTRFASRLPFSPLQTLAMSAVPMSSSTA